MKTRAEIQSMETRAELENLIRDLYSVNPVVRCEREEIPISEETFMGKGGMSIIYGNKNRALKFSCLGTYVERLPEKSLQEIMVEYKGEGILDMHSVYGEEDHVYLNEGERLTLAHIDIEEVALDLLKDVKGVVKKNNLRFFKLKNGQAYTLCSVFDLERVNGRSYDQVLADSDVVMPADYLQFILQCTKIRAEMAKQGISHRDIKPSNIILQVDGIYRFIDLGIAELLDREKLQAHQGRTIYNGGLLHDEEKNTTYAGTRDYISPETLTGRTPPAKSDIYSLGAIIYKILTGKPPISADNYSQYLLYLADLGFNKTRAHIFYQGLVGSLIGKGCPEGFAIAVALALHPDPEKRTDENLIKEAERYLSLSGNGLPTAIVDNEISVPPTIQPKAAEAPLLPRPPIPSFLEETLAIKENPDFYIPFDGPKKSV